MYTIEFMMPSHVIHFDFVYLIRQFRILQPSVDIKTVLSQLMERLSNYAASSAEVLPEFLQVEAFSKLSHAIGKVKCCVVLKNSEVSVGIIFTIPLITPFS